eukprot:1490124-Amphidinium_carterae.1
MVSKMSVSLKFKTEELANIAAQFVHLKLSCLFKLAGKRADTLHEPFIQWCGFKGRGLAQHVANAFISLRMSLSNWVPNVVLMNRYARVAE